MYVDQWIQFMTQRNQDVQVIIQEKNQSSMPVVANVNNVSVWCKAKVIFYKFAENQENLNSCSLISKFAGDYSNYVVLSKPLPTCICNHSGGVPRAYSLVACEANPMPWVSNVCWANWNIKLTNDISTKIEKRKRSIKHWYTHQWYTIFGKIVFPCNMLLDFDLNNEKHLSELCHSCSNMLSQWSLVVLLCIHTQNNAHVYHVHTYESSMQFFKLPFFSQSL